MAAVAPAALTAARVVLRSLLFPFAVLAGYFFAWGIVFCMDAVVRAFFGTVTGAIGWIPFAGRVVSAPLHAIEQKLTSFLGGLELHFENQMATRWHTLAQLVSGYAQDTVAAAVYDWHVAQKIAQVWGEAASGRLGARFQNWVKGELAKLHGTTVRIVRITKIIDHPVHTKIGGAVHVIVRPISAALTHAITWDLPRLRARDRALSDELGRLWKWAHRRIPIAAAGIGLGVFVHALGRLGLGWVRCSNVGKVGKRLCGMNTGLLDALLLDSVLLASGFSIVTLAHELVSVEDEIVGLVKRGVHELKDVDVPSAAEALASGEW